MADGSPQQIVKGGDVTVSGGNAGPHGNGGDFTMIGGTIKGGDAVSAPPMPNQKPWWQRLSESIVARTVAGIVVALVIAYFGLRQ